MTPQWLRSGGYALTVVCLLSACDHYTAHSVKTLTMPVDSLSQIVLVKDSLVKPIIYTSVSGLGKVPVKRSKNLFISAVLPSILIARHQVEEHDARLAYLAEHDDWDEVDSAFYMDLKSRYKATDLTNLRARLKPLPNSIVLAQAAMESGWGQSRFFREGNNIFGMWSYRADEPRIRAGKARGDKFVYVRAYENMVHAITDYYRTIGSARAYRGLRKAHFETEDPYTLLPYLRYYSEKRMTYVALLETLIKKNKLTQYDHYRIDPAYIVKE